MSTNYSKAKYILMGAITFMMSSTSFAIFGGMLERIDCRSMEASSREIFRTDYPMADSDRPDFERYFKARLCSGSGNLNYIKNQNESLANLDTQSNVSIVRELAAAYKKYCPDLTIKPLLQYCAGKIPLKTAMNDYGANGSHEGDFAKEVDRIVRKYDYGSGARCGHVDPVYEGDF